MLPSRCSSARQEEGQARSECSLVGWGIPWAGLPVWRHPSGSIYILHAPQKGQVAAGVTGRLSGEGRSSLGWWAPVVPSLWEPLQARSTATLMICLDRTVDVCPRLHTYSCTASMLPQLQEWLLSWTRRSGRRGGARTPEGLQLPSWSGPTSPPLPQTFPPAHSHPHSLPNGQALFHLWHLLQDVLFPCRRECLL